MSLKIFKNNKKTIISVFLVVFLFVFSINTKNTLSTALVIDIVRQFEEYVERPLIKKLGAIALQKLSDKVTDMILSAGRDGGPALVNDWREFNVKSSKRGENIFRAQVGYVSQKNILCPGSRKLLDNIFLGTLVSPQDLIDSIPNRSDRLRFGSLDSYQSKVKCTIPDDVYKDYEADFQQGGGWDTWKRIIEPQNNFYGLLAKSLEELGTQRSLELAADTGETRSSGFLSKRGSCVGQGANAQCVFFGQVVTPSKILGEAGARTIDSSFDWIISSDNIGGVIVSVINASLTRLNDFVKNTTDGALTLDEIEEAQNLLNQELEAKRAAEAKKAETACLNACNASRTTLCGIEKSTCNTETGNPDFCEVEYNSCLNDAQNSCKLSCKTN